MRDPRTFDDHIAPIKRRGWAPERHRRVAVRLAHYLKARKVAHIFDVSIRTIRRWKTTTRL